MVFDGFSKIEVLFPPSIGWTEAVYMSDTAKSVSDAGINIDSCVSRLFVGGAYPREEYYQRLGIGESWRARKSSLKTCTVLSSY